jgi:capsular polysaccharide biosynthesis protein
VNRLRPDDSRLNPNFSQQGSTPSADEPGIDVRRYLGALRRSRGLIIAIVVVMTVGILALSLALPNKYDATATVVLDAETSALTSPDAVSTQRRLTTLNLLLTSGDVIDKADEQLAEQHPGASSPSITSTVDPNANILRITATGQDAEVAAAYANDVARSFLDVQAKLERNRYEAASADVRAQLATLDDTTDAADLASALRDRLSELAVQAASAGSDLQLAETASVPSSPASPRPLRNTVLAFFTALFIAVLVALGRDLLRPRVSDPRELSQLLGIPVLAAIPHLRRRLGRRRRIGRAIEYEAYETLRSAIQIGSSSRSPQVIMVTSALHAEGKTTVTARLGRALARSGKRTLLVSADLRWPALHREFDLEVEPGLSDVLKLAERAGISDHLLPAAIHQIGGDVPARVRLRLRARRRSADARDRRHPGPVPRERRGAARRRARAPDRRSRHRHERPHRSAADADARSGGDRRARRRLAVLPGRSRRGLPAGVGHRAGGLAAGRIARAAVRRGGRGPGRRSTPRRRPSARGSAVNPAGARERKRGSARGRP